MILENKRICLLKVIAILIFKLTYNCNTIAMLKLVGGSKLKVLSFYFLWFYDPEHEGGYKQI